MWRTDSLWFEAAVVLGIFAVGNILFGHFEQHRPAARRLSTAGRGNRASGTWPWSLGASAVAADLRRW
jgi:hypothetical protein